MQLHGDHDTAKFEPLLGCLFAWKYEADVIKLIKTWLDSVVAGVKPAPAKKSRAKKAEKEKSKKGGKRGRKTTASDGEEDDSNSIPAEAPIIAMRLLNLVMEKDAMREKFFKRFELSSGILESFWSYLDIIEKRFSSKDEKLYENISDEILYRVMDLLTRFLLHAFGTEDAQWREKSDELLSHLLTWTNDTLLPVLQDDIDEDNEEMMQAYVFIEKVANHFILEVPDLAC